MSENLLRNPHIQSVLAGGFAGCVTNLTTGAAQIVAWYFWVFFICACGRYTWRAWRATRPQTSWTTHRLMTKANYQWRDGYYKSVSPTLPDYIGHVIEYDHGAWRPICWTEHRSDALEWCCSLTFADPWSAHCYAEVEQWGSQ